MYLSLSLSLSKYIYIYIYMYVRPCINVPKCATSSPPGRAPARSVVEGMAA